MAFVQIRKTLDGKYQIVAVSETDPEQENLNILKKALKIIDMCSDRVVIEFDELRPEENVITRALVKVNNAVSKNIGNALDDKSIEAFFLGFIHHGEIIQKDVKYEFGMEGYSSETFNKRKELMHHQMFNVGYWFRIKFQGLLPSTNCDDGVLGVTDGS